MYLYLKQLKCIKSTINMCISNQNNAKYGLAFVHKSRTNQYLYTEKLGDDSVEILRVSTWYPFVVPYADLLVQVLLVTGCEGGMKGTNLIQHATHGPNV